MNHSRKLVRMLAPITGLALALVTLPDIQATNMSATGDDISVTIPADIPTSGDAQLDEIIYLIGEREGVDPRLIHAVIWEESRYNQSAVSHVGAQGLMQLMPADAKRFGCDDRGDAESNVEAGTKRLRWLLNHFDGDVSLALAGYNAGEGAVEKSHGIPAFAETQNYVRIIEGRYGKTYHPMLAPEDAATYFNLFANNAGANPSAALETLATNKSITIYGTTGYGKMSLTKLPDGSNKLTVTESVQYSSPDESVGAGRVEVVTLTKDGREVGEKRIYYAPALETDKVRKFRQLASSTRPVAEILPVGAEFTFWVGEGDDPTPISDMVTITVQPKYNPPVELLLKDSI